MPAKLHDSSVKDYSQMHYLIAIFYDVGSFLFHYILKKREKESPWDLKFSIVFQVIHVN